MFEELLAILRFQNLAELNEGKALDEVAKS